MTESSLGNPRPIEKTSLSIADLLNRPATPIGSNLTFRLIGERQAPHEAL